MLEIRGSAGEFELAPEGAVGAVIGSCDQRVELPALIVSAVEGSFRSLLVQAADLRGLRRGPGAEPTPTIGLIEK